jgi:hypothetical protein
LNTVIVVARLPREFLYNSLAAGAAAAAAVAAAPYNAAVISTAGIL